MALVELSEPSQPDIGIERRRRDADPRSGRRKQMAFSCAECRAGSLAAPRLSLTGIG